MAKKLYGNNIQPSCEFCQHGKKSSDGNAALCLYKGVMPLYHHCFRFVYDPLKRIPHRRPIKETYSPKDFSLDEGTEKA